MGRTDENRKQLGQYFTPPVIAEFMLELVGFNPLWKVIDPACGEGIFLLKALERGCAKVAGIDIDPEALKRADELLRRFQGSYRLFHQDGLQPIQTSDASWRNHYDLVIGNPPFSATGNRIRDPDLLKDFELAHVVDKDKDVQQLKIWDETVEVRRRRRKPSLPIEVLFLEQFLKLTRPGGKVAIILPEGVLANRNLRYVREWLFSQFTVRSIISLPRETFKDMGTSAKTAILYLENRKPPEDHEMVLAEVSEINPSPDATLDDNSALLEILKFMKQLDEDVSLIFPQVAQGTKTAIS